MTLIKMMDADKPMLEGLFLFISVIGGKTL